MIAGCEVVYEHHPESVASSSGALWSPDGSTLAMLSIQEGRQESVLLLRHHIGQQHRLHRLDLPFAHRLSPSNMAFGASSKYLLALGMHTHAVSVDVATAAVRLQPEAEPEAVPEGALRLGVVCGSTGYVAVAFMHNFVGSISLLLAAGSPVRLQLLHHISTWMAVTQLSFAASGLLCCWAEIDATGPGGVFQQGSEPGCVNVGGRVKIVCCEVATGRCTIIARQQLSKAEWHLSTQACEGITACFEPGFGLGSPSSMLISGPAPSPTRYTFD